MTQTKENGLQKSFQSTYSRTEPQCIKRSQTVYEKFYKPSFLSQSFSGMLSMDEGEDKFDIKVKVNILKQCSRKELKVLSESFGKKRMFFREEKNVGSINHSTFRNGMGDVGKDEQRRTESSEQREKSGGEGIEKEKEMETEKKREEKEKERERETAETFRKSMNEQPKNQPSFNPDITKKLEYPDQRTQRDDVYSFKNPGSEAMNNSSFDHSRISRSKGRIFQNGIHLTTCPLKPRKMASRKYMKTLEDIEVPEAVYRHWDIQ